MYKKKIDNAGAGSWSNDWNAPASTREDDGEVTFPEDVGRVDNQEYIRGYERYYKVDVEEYRVFEKFSGKEDLLNEDKYKEYLKKPAYRINGELIADEEQAAKIYTQLVVKNEQKWKKEIALMQEAGYDKDSISDVHEKGPEEVDMVKLEYSNLVEQKQIEVVQVSMKRVKQCVIAGDTKLYSRILPLENYPIVPVMNIHTRTPYPMSDVRLVKPLQEYINKTRSLIIAHATTSTNTKILVPEGSVDMKDFEEKWAQPGVAIPYDPTDGAPVPVQPTPLPNELYQNETTAKNDIDHALGLYEMMMGNSQSAPSTYKATISIDEFGQRKMKSKLADIEAALTRIGQLAIPLMQQLYTTEKTIRVVQPNNSITKYMLN